MWRKHRQLLGFCIVGGMNALLSMFIYNVGLMIGLHYILANMTAFLITVANGFYWNRNHVFKTASKGARLKFLTVYLFSFGVGSLLLWLFVWVFCWNKSIAQLPVLVICTMINYSCSKLWVFHDAATSTVEKARPKDYPFKKYK